MLLLICVCGSGIKGSEKLSGTAFSKLWLWSENDFFGCGLTKSNRHLRCWGARWARDWNNIVKDVAYAQLQLQEKAVDKRQRCLEDQLAVLALQEQEGSLERVPRSALQLVAAAHGEHARARADQERARLLVDVQGKYSALLEAEAGLRAKLEHLEQCLDREQEKNAVLRAMVEESAAAADAIGEWVPCMSCMQWPHLSSGRFLDARC